MSIKILQDIVQNTLFALCTFKKFQQAKVVLGLVIFFFFFPTALTTSNVYDNLIAKFRGFFYTNSVFRMLPQEMTICIFLPADPTLAHQMSAEQGINLAWH